jgi:D-alanine-D-alanine ligase
LSIDRGEEQDERIDDRFAEWDTWETISAVRDALATQHTVTMMEADNSLFESLQRLRPQIVFNIAEGYYGISREAQVPAMLDMLNIPYTGSDPLTLAVCLDKARTKEILTYHNIPNAKFLSVGSLDEISNHSLEFPLVVKPIGEGSGKGIFSSSFVQNQKELETAIENVLNEYKQPALVEEFLSGREFTVAVIGNNGDARALPIVEISFDAFPKDFVPMYSYEAKWILDSKDHQLDVYHCPARIDDELTRTISDTALRTYHTLRCKDWSRIDIRLDKHNIPNIIEVNPLPGILPDPKDNSCYPTAARAAGYSYNDMILNVLNAARKRYDL